MNNNESVKNSVMNTRKPGGGSKGSMVSTMSKQTLQVFAFTVRYLHSIQQVIDFTEWDMLFLKQYKEHMGQIKMDLMISQRLKSL